MMSVSIAQKIELPLIPIKSCSVWLPNNQSSFITHCVLRIAVKIQGVNIEANFEVWDGTRYEVKLGMAWFKQVDAWIACKEGTVHGKLQNGNFFSIREEGISVDPRKVKAVDEWPVLKDKTG